jgi:hypothetical protein
VTVSGGTIITAALGRLTGEDGPPVTTSRLPAREAAERELSKPMYHEHDPGLVQRAFNRFWEWVTDLLDAASGATPGGIVGLIAILVIVLLLAAALWWRLGTPRRSASTGDSGLFDDRLRSAAEHRTAAEEHAAANRWNEAVQERMRAVVRSLEERTLLDDRPGRTADEAAAEAARPLPDHADRLRAAARVFDDVTYGGRTMGAPEYQELSRLDEDLLRTKPQFSGATPGSAR